MRGAGFVQKSIDNAISTPLSEIFSSILDFFEGIRDSFVALYSGTGFLDLDIWQSK